MNSKVSLSLTNREIVETQVALSSVLNKELSAPITFRMMKIYNSLASDVKAFHEIKKKLFEKYGEPEKDSKIEIKEENLEEFTNHFNALLDEKNEYDFSLLSESDFNDIKISGAELMPLQKIIKGE